MVVDLVLHRRQLVKAPETLIDAAEQSNSARRNGTDGSTDLMIPVAITLEAGVYES